MCTVHASHSNACVCALTQILSITTVVQGASATRSGEHLHNCALLPLVALLTQTGVRAARAVGVWYNHLLHRLHAHTHTQSVFLHCPELHLTTTLRAISPRRRRMFSAIQYSRSSCSERSLPFGCAGLMMLFCVPATKHNNTCVFA